MSNETAKKTIEVIDRWRNMPSSRGQGHDENPPTKKPFPSRALQYGPGQAPQIPIDQDA
jgi:hypothetical protein